MTPRQAADKIADRVFRWTHQVLTPEDREEIAGIVRRVDDEPTTEDEADCEGDCGYHSHGAGEMSAPETWAKNPPEVFPPLPAAAYAERDRYYHACQCPEHVCTVYVACSQITSCEEPHTCRQCDDGSFVCAVIGREQSE